MNFLADFFHYCCLIMTQIYFFFKDSKYMNQGLKSLILQRGKKRNK